MPAPFPLARRRGRHPLLATVAALAAALPSLAVPDPAGAQGGAATPAAPAMRWTLPDSLLFAESIAWDSAGGRWLVSSVHRGGVLATRDWRRLEPLVPAGAGRWSTLGLAVDAPRGLLWATTAALPAYADYAAGDSGRTALLAFDLRTGALRRRLEPPADGRPHVLGDLLATADGTVYVSDGAGGALYRLAPGDTALAPLARLRSPQGLALAPDGRALLVADYGAGVVRVDLASGEARRLAVRDAAADSALSRLRGIDGLARAGRTLFVVQNGTATERILRLELDEAAESIDRVAVCRSGAAELEEPTVGVVAGGRFVYVARSMWDRLGKGGVRDPARPWAPTEVRAIDLADAGCGGG